MADNDVGFPITPIFPAEPDANLQWVIDQMHRLQAVTAAFAAALTPEQVAEIVLNEGIAALGAEAGSLAVLDAEGTMLNIISAVGYTAEIVEAFQVFPLDERFPTSDAVRENTPLWYEDKAAWLAAYPVLAPVIATSAYNAIASLPLTVEQRTIGGIGLSFRESRQFNREERAFGQSLAQYAAQALDRAQLYAQMERRVEQRDAVAQLAQQAISEPLEGLLQHVVAVVARTLALPICSIFQFEAKSAAFRLEAGVGWQNDLVGTLLIESQPDHHLDHCLQVKQPVVIKDLASERPFTVPEAPPNAVSCISRAIVGHDKGFGVLSAYATSARSFSTDEILFMQSVAYIVAAAADRNASEHERLLLERQLQQTQKLESLGILAGGIAHDFNNLLVVIMGNASLALLELAPESPARESIEQIEQTAQRAADLTHQMLAYAGRGQFDIRKINLSALIGEMSHLLQASVSKNAVLRYNLSQNLPLIQADATQLRQIVMNLIVNASEAISEKSGIITVSTGAMWVDRAYLNDANAAPDLPERTYVFLEVSDTGQGMNAVTRARIFEPFFTTKHTGRGLGLAAVIGIVRRHNGALRLYSEPGHGTTFKVLLPSITGIGEVISSADSASTWQGSGTALVIDDDEDVRRLVGRMLERLGFGVLTAPDGREGLKLFLAQRNEIACVLLDMTMPHLSGEETFRELRRVRADVRVVLMSGYTEEEITSRFAGKGLAGFLHKPFTPQRLRDKLQAILPDAGSATTNAPAYPEGAKEQP